MHMEKYAIIGWGFVITATEVWLGFFYLFGFLIFLLYVYFQLKTVTNDNNFFLYTKPKQNIFYNL